MQEPLVDDKLERLREIVGGIGPCAVAYSAGVDSTLLLAVAHEVLGGRVAAITADTPAHPASELAEAQSFCAQHGIRHIVLAADQLAVPGLELNPPDRCYLCKRHLFEAMGKRAEREGFPILLEGSNADDMDAYRPGFAAVRELGARSPLLEAGMTKADVRAASKLLGLATHDKPSATCLLTRFPYGQLVTHEALHRAGCAEALLHELGIGQLRVRIEGAEARIEVLPDDFPLVLDSAKRTRIVDGFKQLGFSRVTLDLQGYRSGSMDEGLEGVLPA